MTVPLPVCVVMRTYQLIHMTTITILARLGPIESAASLLVL